MDAEIFLSFSNNLLGVVAIVIMISIMVFKLKNYKQETDNWDVIRILMIIWFLGILYFNTWEFLYYSTPLNDVIPSSWIAFSYDDIVIQSYSIPVVIVCGLYIVGYANNWKVFKIVPVIYYAILIALVLILNFTLLYIPSMLISYLLVIVFLIYTAIKLKDNGALGLTIFFLLTMFVGMTESYLKFILGIISYGFGIYFSLGYFHPLKKKE